MPSPDNGGLVAPSLSTYQDDLTFSYSKVKEDQKIRSHLNLQPGEDYLEKIHHYYSIPELASFLKQKDDDGNPKHKRVTLQFPDELICDSASIVHALQKELGLLFEGNVPEEACENCTLGCKKTPAVSKSQRLWILADTSYSSCCIDEVAAEHVLSDLVVHFGDACLNVADKLAAVYVFGRPHLDIEKLAAQFRTRYASEESPKVLLMANAPHTRHLKPLYDILQDEYPNLGYADLYIDPASPATTIGYTPQDPEKVAISALNRTLLHVPKGENIDSLLSAYEVFHISQPETPRLLQLTTRFLLVTLYDAEKETLLEGPYPNLMRRYRYMHMARSAGTVGLLVNTLSLANTKVLINTIGKKIKEYGKKHYVFVVGKPNVAKLANFENVDMWCVLGCDHQGIILDQTNEYFRPIVTPYELMLALSDELSWTGKWVTDFKQVLEGFATEEETKEESIHDDGDDDDDEHEEPEFNPVTGQYVSSARPLRRLQHLQISQEAEKSDETTDEHRLVKKLSGAVAIKNTVSTSAIHLQNREWTGLGSDWVNDEEDGATVEEGRGGIARGYDYDRATNK